jgi:hypothetical protein
MAAPELTATTAAVRPSRSPGLVRASLAAYVAIWSATLAPAIVVALAGRMLARTARDVLGLRLAAGANPPPDAHRLLELAAHNLPIAAWPLLLGVVGAHRHRFATKLADGLVVAWIVANALPVGAALGAYGPPLIPYLPQLPLEWAALALGAGAWFTQRSSALALRDTLACLALIAGALLGAAAVETVAVAHR